MEIRGAKLFGQKNSWSKTFRPTVSATTTPDPYHPLAPPASASAPEHTTSSAATPPPLRTRRPGQWCWLDTAIVATYGPRIGAYGVAVYAVLAQHANGRTQACWPSIGRIASLLKLSRSTVKKTLRTLEAEGLLTVQARRDPEGDPTSHCYTLLDPTPESPASVVEVRAGGRSSDNPPPATTQPTGRPSDSHKPPAPQSAERTSTPSDDRSASKERKPNTEPADETSSWNTPPVLLPETPTDRPDDVLLTHHLDAGDQAALEQAAKVILRARWGNRVPAIVPVVQATVLELLDGLSGLWDGLSASPVTGEEAAPCAAQAA